MDIKEIRAVIKYFYIKKFTTTETHDELQNTLGEGVTSYSTVKKWYSEFKKGRESTKDAPRSGRPSDASTKETCDEVLAFVMEDK